jgi:hypothetical protein
LSWSCDIPFVLFVVIGVQQLLHPWLRRERGVQAESEIGEILLAFLGTTENNKIFDLFRLKRAEGLAPKQRPR